MNKRMVIGTAVFTAMFFSITASLATSNFVFAKTRVRGEEPAEYEYDATTSERDKSFETTKGGRNVILATDGSVNFLSAIISKSGDDGSNDAINAGKNAAVLSTNSAKIIISDSRILTNGKHAYALFAYGDSTIDVSDTTINVKGKDSGALVVANGGTMVATGATVETSEKTSYLVRYNKGGGDVTIAGGKYTSVLDGVMIENNGTLTMTDVTVDTPKGDTIVVRDAEVKINLKRVAFTYGDETNAVKKGNNDKHDFMDIEAGKVTLISRKNPIFGNIVADKKSEIDMRFLERTSFEGTINKNNSAKNIKVKLDKKSRIVLMGDSYISSLINDVKDNSNIFANGHKLFVGGKEVKINEEIAETWDYDESEKGAEADEEIEEKDKTDLYILLGAFSFAFVVALIWTVVIINSHKREKQRRVEQKAVEKASSNKMKKPWEKK